MNKICIAICAFSLICLWTGCSPKASSDKVEQKAVQEATAPQAAESEQAPKTAASSENSQVADIPNTPNVALDNAQANPNPQTVIPYSVSYKDHPEIRAEITKKDTEWGHIERTSLVWHNNIDIFYERPVFQEKTPALAKINQVMQAHRDDFFSQGQMESALDYETQRQEQYPDETDKYLNTLEFDKIQITDDYISFTLSRAWFMGGTNSFGQMPFTFNPQTGAPITLTDLYKKSPNDIQKMVIQAVKDHTFDGKDMINWDDLAKVKDFSFYITDGIPHVVFQKYEIAPGAAGAFDIPLPKPNAK